MQQRKSNPRPSLNAATETEAASRPTNQPSLFTSIFTPAQQLIEQPQPLPPGETSTSIWLQASPIDQTQPQLVAVHQESELSAGEIHTLQRRAEELVSQVLPSDESLDEPQSAKPPPDGLPGVISSQQSEPGFFGTNLQHPGQREIYQSAAQPSTQQSEVLSPSRIQEPVNQDESYEVGENPFEVAVQDSDTNSSKESGTFAEVIVERTTSEPSKATLQIKTQSENTKQDDDIIAVEALAAPGDAEAAAESTGQQKDLNLSKQRSNSVEVVTPAQQEKVQKNKRRNLMMPILKFFNPDSAAAQTQRNAPAKESVTKKATKVEESKDVAESAPKSIKGVASETVEPPVAKKKESIFKKLFRSKPADKSQKPPAALEESKAPPESKTLAQSADAASKQAQKTEYKKGEFKSRFERFFGKKKQDNQTVATEPSAVPNQVPPEESKNATNIADKPKVELAPQSSLDTGFTANLGDQYGEEFAENECIGGQDNENVDEEDQDDTGELSNDEIYSALEGVDFRPTPAPVNYQFSFNERLALNVESEPTASHHSNATVSDFTSEQSQELFPPSLPAAHTRHSLNEVGHSQRATVGGSTHSVFSLDERSHTAYLPRQRAHSQLIDVSGALSQTNDDNEWQAVFPGVLQQPQQMFAQQEAYPDNSVFQQREFVYGVGYTVHAGQHQPNLPVRYSAGLLGHRTAFDSLSSGGLGKAATQFGGSELAPFEPSQSNNTPTMQTGPNPLSLSKKESIRRSISFNIEVRPEHMRNFSNHQYGPSTGGVFLGPQGGSQMRISEPFTPTQGPSFSFFTSQHQKPLSSLGAIQGPSAGHSDIQNPRMSHFSDNNQRMQNMREQPIQLEQTPFQAAPTVQRFNPEMLHPWHPATQSQKSTSGVWSSGPQTGVSSSSRMDRNSNASNSASQNTNNPDTNDSASCSEFMKRNKKRKHRRTKKKGEARHTHEIATGLRTPPSSEDQAASLKCYCCSTGASSCLLELKKEEFNHMTAIDRMKNLIMADQQLTHFQPIDMRKTGGSTTNCARACIEGRIKDDIWHECCNCCSQVRNTLLSEMQGIASELCRDQLCSKFIQVQLSRCPQTEPALIDFFFKEIIRDEEILLESENSAAAEQSKTQPEQQDLNSQGQESKKNSSIYAASLMKNVFGNYVAQLIFERGTTERKQQFYSVMLKQAHRLAADQYGCRIIQKAIVWLPFERKIEIIGQFEPSKLMSMMFSEEGNYILQCIVLNLPTEHIQFMLPLIETKLLELCRDRRGCRVIQRVLEKFPRHELASIIDKIIAAANELTPQQYGNYVIAHILQKGPEEEKIKILDSIMDNIVRFSLYQLGSNVVENCLKTAPADYLNAILERISAVPVATPEGSRDVSMVQLLENQFGNYVIQHAFNLSQDERKRVLNDKIEQAAAEGHVQKTNMYAKHVFTLLHQHYASECKTCQQRHQRQLHSFPHSHSHTHSNEATSATRDSTPFTQAQTTATTPTPLATSSKKVRTSNAKSASEQQSSNSTLKSSGDQEVTRFSAGLSATAAAAAAKTPTKTGVATRKGSKSAATVEEEDKEVSDDDVGSLDNEEGGATEEAQGKRKRQRRRRRRGKAKKGDAMLFQEDILEQLSDQDREEYLQKIIQQPESAQQLPQQQSLFVLGGASSGQTGSKSLIKGDSGQTQDLV